jgi:hypothetical protein
MKSAYAALYLLFCLSSPSWSQLHGHWAYGEGSLYRIEFVNAFGDTTTRKVPAEDLLKISDEKIAALCLQEPGFGKSASLCLNSYGWSSFRAEPRAAAETFEKAIAFDSTNFSPYINLCDYYNFYRHDTAGALAFLAAGLQRLTESGLTKSDKYCYYFSLTCNNSVNTDGRFLVRLQNNPTFVQLGNKFLADNNITQQDMRSLRQAAYHFYSLYGQ